MLKLSQKSQRHLTLRIREAKAYRRYMLPAPQSSQTHFAIVCDYRSGSTLLASLLNSHPDIFCDIELFLPFLHADFKKILFPYAYVHGHSKRQSNMIYGFDLKTHQILSIYDQNKHRFRQLIESMHERNWQFIYLERINLLKQCLSNMLSNRRQKWQHKSSQKFQREKILVNLSELASTLERHIAIAELNQSVFSSTPHLKLTYERDLEHSSNHQNTADSVFDYLSLRSVKVSTELKRISSSKWSEDIANLDEVIDFVESSKYKEYLL